MEDRTPVTATSSVATPAIEGDFVGLKCDAPGCGWSDMTITRAKYEGYRNAPCPSCGSNILTDADWQMIKNLEAAMAWTNQAAAKIGLPSGPIHNIELEFSDDGKFTVRATGEQS